jgi:hypothetical protein
MKIVFTYAVVMLFSLTLAHSASWEGSDDFSSATVTESLWGAYKQKFPSLYTYVANGRLGVIHNSDEHAVARVWGKKWYKVPTAACWKIQVDIFLPSTPTSTRTEFAKAGLGVTPSANSKQDLGLGVKQEFWQGNATGLPILLVDDEFRTNPNAEELYLGQDTKSFRLKIVHDALRMTDILTIARLDSGATVEERQVVSGLPAAKEVVLFVFISGKPSWSAQGTDLGIDNWSVVENNPDPIHLNSQNATYKGVAYSVSVTGLDLVNQKLTGTVALTVGSASASIPITGSIDKNGFFALTAKGVGANKGFGCALLYDVATGTYRPNKNTVTALKQKAIKF